MRPGQSTHSEAGSRSPDRPPQDADESELRDLLVDAHWLLFQRDEEIARLHDDVARFRREYLRSQATIAEIRSTRVWRLASALWRVRRRLRRQ